MLGLLSVPQAGKHSLLLLSVKLKIPKTVSARKCKEKIKRDREREKKTEKKTDVSFTIK